MKKFDSILCPLLILALALLPGRLPAQGAVLNQPAPALVFNDLSGKEISLAALKGKTIVVDFWATWCGPCLTEIPGYIELQKKYGKDGLVIIGVSLDRKSAEQVRQFAQDHDINYPVVMGDSDTVEAFGGFSAIPTTFLIDRNGRIVHQKTGAMDHAAYEAIVRKLL